jgi:hypothetical protein
MRFDNCTGTSLNGHRLICRTRKVLGQEAAERTLLALFKRYHEQEVDITRLDLLVRIGVEVSFARPQEVEIVGARETHGMACAFRENPRRILCRGTRRPTEGRSGL